MSKYICALYWGFWKAGPESCITSFQNTGDTPKRPISYILLKFEILNGVFSLLALDF